MWLEGRHRKPEGNKNEQSLTRQHLSYKEALTLEASGLEWETRSEPRRSRMDRRLLGFTGRREYSRHETPVQSRAG